MSATVKNKNPPLSRSLVREKEEVEPSELWLALTAIPRPHKLVPFPRAIPGTSTPVGEIAMWPLTQEEQMAANAEADRFTKRLMSDPQKRDEANLGYHHTYTNDVAIQVLHRACRSSEDLDRPAFPSPEQMRRALTTDEVGVLFASYLTVQSEIGPIVAHMTDEEREALILRLHEGGSAFPFDSLSWEQQRDLVLSMASQIASCWTVMFSAGLPLAVSSFVTDSLREKLGGVTTDEAETGAAGNEDHP
jgi:hypothetical protein